MIVYVASYPRSGNFWLQTLLGNQFKYPTTNIHVAFDDIEKQRDQAIKAMKRWYDIDVFRLSPKTLETQFLPLSDWLLGYNTPGNANHNLFLLSGCHKLVNELPVRQLLADDSRLFFLKTHFDPFPKYLPGEFVIQIVRHPGAVIWSYFNFKRDMKNMVPDTLSGVIQKDPAYGNWSEYHQKWISAAERLGSRYCLVKYEDVKGRELELCDRLSGFLNQPVRSRELRPFEFYHKLRPAITRQGKADGWEQNYSKDQIEMLWEIHHEMMRYYGYSKPDSAL